MGLYPRKTRTIELDLPAGPYGNVFYVDAVYGDDSHDGLRPEKPLLTIPEAYDKCVAGQNDVVAVIAGAYALTATLTWAKNYTHLVGLAAPTMTAVRARIYNEATEGLTPLLNITATGCIFKDFYIFQGVDEAVANINVQVSGGRCTFKNVHFAGGGHASQAIDGGASLRLVGSEGEHLFEDCTVGVDTIAQATGMSCLTIIGGTPRNVFRRCHFISYAGAVGAAFVEWETLSAVDRYMIFEDCAFINTGTSTMTQSFAMPAGAPAHRRVILLNCWSYGSDLWDFADRGYIYSNMINANFGADAGGVTVAAHA